MMGHRLLSHGLLLHHLRDGLARDFRLWSLRTITVALGALSYASHSRIMGFDEDS